MPLDTCGLLINKIYKQIPTLSIVCVQNNVIRFNYHVKFVHFVTHDVRDLIIAVFLPQKCTYGPVSSGNK